MDSSSVATHARRLAPQAIATNLCIPHPAHLPYSTTTHVTMATPLCTLALRRISRTLPRRCRPFSTTHAAPAAFSWGPAPPRLPRDEQELFEKLQKASTGAFSQPQAQEQAHTTTPSPAAVSSTNGGTAAPLGNDAFHPNLRRGAPPEFEGDVNPATGEVGGPKNEPLRWGGTGDWSYNGRVSDF